MAQTPVGAIKIAAKHVGLTYEEYLERVTAGEKHCRICRAWHPLSAFAADASRRDGLTSACRDSRNSRSRQLYEPIPLNEQQPKGPPCYPSRNGDKVQARQRVNKQVKYGKRPHPNTLPCADCGHTWAQGRRRHEYHHYLGYSAEHHDDVIALCTLCHKARHKKGK